jgi:hypothetical protein
MQVATFKKSIRKIFSYNNITYKETGPNERLFVVLGGQLAARQEGVAGGGNTYADS